MVAVLCKMARSIGHKVSAKGSRTEAAILGRESATIESIGKPRFDLAGDERLRGDLVSEVPRAKRACKWVRRCHGAVSPVLRPAGGCRALARGWVTRSVIRDD